MLLGSHSQDPEDQASDKVQFPHGSVFARKLDGSPAFDSELISSQRGFWDTPIVIVSSSSPTSGQSRLSSKGSDYEDIWSAAESKSDGSMSDASKTNDDLSVSSQNASSSAKAVGKALRDLDALGDWIENELHGQCNISNPQAVNNDYENTSPTPEPETNIVVNHSASSVCLRDASTPPPPLPEKMRVIRRGKRRFMGQDASNLKNRFSAPNLAVEDILSECCSESVSSSSFDLNEASTGNFPEASFVIAEPIAESELSDHAAEELVCFSPPRKCIPSRDSNIIDSFHSKVAALKRVGSKLLNRKTSVKSGTTGSTLPKDEKKMPELLEEVLVFRAKKPTFDTCWPVDNDNWSMLNRVTPTSGVSSGTSSSTKSVDLNNRNHPSRSSESPTCSVHERSETVDDFTHCSRNLEQDISLERTVNFVIKNAKADFALFSQISLFLHTFASAPAENVADLFCDLNSFLSVIKQYVSKEHRMALKDFMSRDLSENACNPERYIDKAVQRLVIEPLHSKLVWNLQSRLGNAGELEKLEKGCEMLELVADNIVKPEIQSAVIKNLTLITAHFKNFAEAQNTVSKSKQLLTVFHDIFGIQAEVLQQQYSDLIPGFVFAIVKSKAYTVEVHLDLLWSLQQTEINALDSFLLLLAASCATDVLKNLGSGSELPKNMTDQCMAPVKVEAGSSYGCVTVTHNVRVPLDRRITAGHLIQLICEALDLPMDKANKTRLQLTSGCLRIDQKDDLPVKPALERWQKIYPDCILTLLIETEAHFPDDLSVDDH